MVIDGFVAHVDEHGKDIREAMIEYWLASVGMKLSRPWRRYQRQLWAQRAFA